MPSDSTVLSLSLISVSLGDKRHRYSMPRSNDLWVSVSLPVKEKVTYPPKWNDGGDQV